MHPRKELECIFQFYGAFPKSRVHFERQGAFRRGPGYSEHQIGLAVDINGATYDLYFWLQENSYKYGFIFRYPGDKTDITGVAEEVWHYRYVGVEAATEMYEKGLCLEEYLAERQAEQWCGADRYKVIIQRTQGIFHRT